jgi:hypothetical protein
VAASMLSFAASIAAALHFLLFLHDEGFRSAGGEDRTGGVTSSVVRLAVDGALVSGFGLVHTLLRASGPVLGADGARLRAFAPRRSMIRAVYVMATAATAELVMAFWQVSTASSFVCLFCSSDLDSSPPGSRPRRWLCGTAASSSALPWSLRCTRSSLSESC